MRAGWRVEVIAANMVAGRYDPPSGRTVPRRIAALERAGQGVVRVPRGTRGTRMSLVLVATGSPPQARHTHTAHSTGQDRPS